MVSGFCRGIGQKGRIVFFLIFLAFLCFLPAGCSAAPGLESGGEAETAQELLEAGSYREAAEALTLEIGDGAGTEENWRLLGIAWMGCGEYESAADALETALEEAGIFPGDTEFDINYYLGVCYYKLGRYEEALEVYDAILALRPKAADALELRGTVRLAAGDEEGMLEDFRQAIALDAEDYDRLLSIWQTLTDNGYEEEGQQLLEEALEDGSGSMSNYDLGRISYYAGDYETARTALEQLQNSSDGAAVLMLGRTYEALGDYNYAANVYLTYLSQDTDAADVYNQLGLCYLQMSDYESALEAFESGIAVGESEALQSLRFNEITAYEYLGDFGEAQSLMAEYAADYPGDETAAREYVFLETR